MGRNIGRTVRDRTMVAAARLIAPLCLGLALMVAGFGLAPAGAPPGNPHLVIIQTMPVPACEAHLKWLLIQFGELGYRPDENCILTVIRADGDRARADSGLEEALKTKKPAVVVTIATLASQAAVQRLAGTDIPVIFFQVSDPVGAGLIKELNRASETNITGRVFTVPRQVRLTMALRLVGPLHPGRPVRFGYIHSSYPSSEGDRLALDTAAADNPRVEFVMHRLPYRQVPEGGPAMLADVRTAMEALKGRGDYWWHPLGALGELPGYARLLADESDTPTVVGANEAAVRQGAMMHLTPDLEAGAREIALLADTVIRGRNPGDIPVNPPLKFALGFNLTTILEAGAVIPPDMLEMAGDRIYR